MCARRKYFRVKSLLILTCLCYFGRHANCCDLMYSVCCQHEFHFEAIFACLLLRGRERGTFPKLLLLWLFYFLLLCLAAMFISAFLPFDWQILHNQDHPNNSEHNHQKGETTPHHKKLKKWPCTSVSCNLFFLISGISTKTLISTLNDVIYYWNIVLHFHWMSREDVSDSLSLHKFTQGQGCVTSGCPATFKINAHESTLSNPDRELSSRSDCTLLPDFLPSRAPERKNKVIELFWSSRQPSTPVSCMCRQETRSSDSARRGMHLWQLTGLRLPHRGKINGNLHDTQRASPPGFSYLSIMSPPCVEQLIIEKKISMINLNEIFASN